MKMTQRVALAAAVMLIAVGCASGSGSSSEAGDSTGDSDATQPTSGDVADLDAYVSLVRAANEGDHEVYQSAAELAAASDLIVLAEIGPVVGGRDLYSAGERDAAAGPDYPALVTAAFEVNVLEVLGGNDPSIADTSFLVEVFRPANKTLDDVAAVTPVGQRALLFLLDYTVPGPNTDARGGTEGERYLFPYPQGFVVEHDGEIVSVMGGLIEPSGYDSIDAVATDLRAARE